MDRSTEPARGSVVRSFVRRFHTEILAEWRRLARTLPEAEHLSALALVDHLPEMLEEIADVAQAIVAGDSVDGDLAMARRHALDRLQAGFDIAAVVEELSMLRGCVLSVWMRENPSGNMQELRALNLAIDRAVASSVARYVEARDRTMSGMDRIATAALESRTLEDLLSRLLMVFVETTPAVDTAAIFLRVGDRVHLRAAVGLDQELEQGFSLAIGEGFAGTIAAKRTPIVLRSAYLDPLIVSEEIRAKRVRAIYGLPLHHDDDVIGVAYMGSVTADELSQDDRHFFESMASRATIGIVHHMLRDELARSEQRHKEIAVLQERALAKLESLLSASPLGIAFVDRELQYLRVNDALASLNGRTAAEHIGKTVAEMQPAFAADAEVMFRRVLETGRSLTNIPVASHGRALLANYFPVQNTVGAIVGVGAIVLDVTHEKRAQDALQFERARLQSILKHAPIAIWVKDAEGRIVLANERLASALGYRLEEVIGQRSEDLLPPAIAEPHREHDQRVMKEGQAIEVEEIVPADGGARTFLSIKFPIPSDPPLVGGIATEITERKKMEEELRAAVRTREDVLAIVSHDLRNPLGTIQLSISMLQGVPQADHRIRRHLEVVHRATVRMETLIDDLLDTANIRIGRLTLETKPEPVDAVVAEAVELLQPSASEKGLQLVRKSETPDLSIVCDRDRVLQVFGNLIGNAIKFCRDGDTITVTAERDGDAVRFSVADTGPGIKPEVLPYLFEAYWSGSDQTKRSSGLGLYISRGIVEGHGGRIWVESTPGQGARFFFTLPIASAP